MPKGVEATGAGVILENVGINSVCGQRGPAVGNRSHLVGVRVGRL